MRKKSLRILWILVCLAPGAAVPAASPPAQNPEYPKLLGNGDPSAPPYRTARYRVLVYANGFDDPAKEPKVKKSGPRKLRGFGLSKQQIDSFKDYAGQLVGLNGLSTLAIEIDEGVEQIRQKWNECGGAYARFINAVDWSELEVRVMDRPFPSRLCGNCLVSGELDGRRIRIVNVMFNRLLSDPENAYLNGVRWLAPWELGNYAWWKFYRNNPPYELGFQSPCGR
jgi:hypothetical protein